MSEAGSALGARRNARFARLARILDFDLQVLTTLLFRGWSVIAGATSVLLIPLWLGRVEQGYYYTFSSLLALQIFFELGMNQVIVQLVSHDFAHVSLEGTSLSGDPVRIGRLSTLVRLLHHWYRTAAALFLLLVSFAGSGFFLTRGALATGEWLGPWLFVVAVTSINLYQSAMLTVLEGCGDVAAVARMRLVQSMLGYASMWAALALGVGLWAVPLVPAVAALYSTYWLNFRINAIRVLRKHSSIGTHGNAIKWRRDIFPLQWRMAVSWISGYFIFQLLIPLTFAREGAVEAGRLGMTLAVFNALQAVAMSWVSAKTPAMATLVARSERRSLDLLFGSLLRRSMAFTAIGVALFLIALVLMGHFYPVLAHRFASVPVAACLAVTTIANGYVFAAASYMRAHKEEPMMWVSIASAIATLGAVSAGSRWGVFPMMALYALVTLVVPVPWTAKIYRTYQTRGPR
jgi:hypothetical protein